MNRLFLLFIFIFCFSLCLSAFGQTPVPTPPIQDNEDVIRISSSLVQTDFIVLDKDGKQVRDLKASDIEIFQDGKLQTIANFSYVKFLASGKPGEKQKGDKNATPIPPVSADSNQLGRLITFIVDDGNCNASHVAVSASTDAVKKFVREQMQPNDRVAIYQTRTGSNLLQQYTSNKDQLLRKVEKIRYFPPLFGCGGGVFQPTTDNKTTKFFGGGRGSFESESDIKNRQGNEQFILENRIIDTAGILNFIVDRLKPITGRKIVFFLSDGLEMPSRSKTYVRDLIDNAGRSSVVFNTIDARGLLAPGATADDTSGRDVGSQLKKLQDTQYGLKFLAEETGGSYYINQNKLPRGIRQILEDQSGYYLIAYQPDDETFKSKDFHNIEVKAKNPDYKVVARSGFYGVEDKPQKVTKKTADSPLYQAINAPIQENGIDARLTTLFQNDAKKGNFIRALMYLNGRDLTLVDEPNGMKKLSIDVVAVTLDEKNKVVDEFNRTHTIHIPKEGVATILQNGFSYTTDVPLKKDGAYSFRMVVRDNNSNRLASASDFVEVPDTKKGKFYMSGLIIAGIGQNGAADFPQAASAEEAISPIFFNTNPAVRQFRSGDNLFYAYTVYNPKIDKAAKKPNLTTQLLLYLDGNLVVEGKEKPIAVAAQTDLTRIAENGLLGITPNVKAGNYVLQIVVRDKISDKTTSQYIDFEVVQ